VRKTQHAESQEDQGIKQMQKVTLYKSNGDGFKEYQDVSAVNTDDGILRFKWERTPGDRTTMGMIITNLPFFLEDDMER
jgi:hypothetical protein